MGSSFAFTVWEERGERIHTRHFKKHKYTHTYKLIQ